jgi:uncharacterized protein (DUF1330 family)
MPKTYMVFSYQSAPDPQKLAAYGKLAIPAFEPFGARLLARGNAAAAYERGLKERIFPSLEKAIAAHDSPDYQEALTALGDGAVRDVRDCRRRGVAPIQKGPRQNSKGTSRHGRGSTRI